MNSSPPRLMGPNKDYTLSDRALRHIIEGEITIRPRNIDGKRVQDKILAGGLHTYSGWEKLVSDYKNITSLANFDSSVHDDWFYARELQNGVIALKIPRQLFSGGAADLTMMPDTHYKSGHLWKTLFPVNFTENEILDCINQALENVDKEHSFTSEKDCHIIGYANTLDPMTALRIRIQLVGNDIRSAFPSWDQPYTGNNGKAYSHADSISFVLSESTLKERGPEYSLSGLFIEGGFSYEKLKELTPKFLLFRTRPVQGQTQDLWAKKRRQTIAKLVDSIANDDIKLICKYLNEFCISKEPSFTQSLLYKYLPREIASNPLDFNACQIMQNVCDCLYLLLLYDNKHVQSNSISQMQRFLAMAATHTGGLNALEYKRLHRLLCGIAISHHNSDSIKIYLECLAYSPSRSTAYLDFNVNTFIKKNDDISMSIIGIDGVEVSLGIRELYDYIALNLGENYLISFNKSERLDIARRLTERQFSNAYLTDSLSFFIGSDFDFFASNLTELLESKNNKTKPSEKHLIQILRDYHRMLVLYRQRVVFEDPQAHSTDPFDFEFMSPEFCEIKIQQHKRLYILITHENFLKYMSKFAKENNYKKLEVRAATHLNQLNTERVPLPQVIPEYIKTWKNDPDYNGPTVTDLSVFGPS